MSETLSTRAQAATASNGAHQDLAAIGLGFSKWQEAVEQAIATNRLEVTGEVRGGQLIQYGDPSGAQLNILAVEPFATFAGFASQTRTFAHITPLNDVVALADVVDPHGNTISSVTVNLAQGPLIVDEPTLQWQELGITALMLDQQRFDSTDAYLAANPGAVLGAVTSPGAEAVGNGAATTPDAAAQLSARVLDAEYRTSELTGQRFIHASVDGAFPFDVCLPDGELPQRDSVIAGTAVLAGSIPAPSGGGCGGCGGSCGCGGH
ncbi:MULTISPECIES: hypothetical protein [Corynebacterium]|uniref:hypothetical protein n=1 Tax=Corynebacterium TaxID=1716 RepID=UPI000BAA3B0F|nr:MULTISPECIES: hypothetical protein [Corynebacterium]PAT02927.1 hypothetical protein CKJ85_10405 [Corynebacterium sp. NML 150383]PAT09335.1 hypothetical protein CKJ82_01220 [Corynebacterium hadale]TVX81002.1 hypothetical protein FPP74_03930 [Corynebacterium sp. NML180780]